MASIKTIWQFAGMIRRYWFLSALLAICLVTLLDRSGTLGAVGSYLKSHHGPDMVVVVIFLLSGFSLSPGQLKDGLMDLKGILLALAVIFVAAPIVAIVFSFANIDRGVIIGLFLVAVMPSTLSSGVVMTEAAGGSAAHALVTTIMANSLAVFTIPYALSSLLALEGMSTTVTIDKTAIMLKIGLLVVLPLTVGMVAKKNFPGLYRYFQQKISIVNQCMILFIVWIAMSQTRGILIVSGLTASFIVIIVFAYHSLLIGCAWGLVRVSGRKRGTRECILFIGGQKTLPLSVILQMSLFPEYGIALLVCVLHHIVHLMMDGFLVERLRAQ